MSAHNPLPSEAIILDAQEREAIRAEIALDGVDFQFVTLNIRNGDRAAVLRQREQLDVLIGALDAIGWHEALEQPDRQPARDLPALARYAEISALELAQAMHEFECDDDDLLTLAVLRRVSEATR